VARAVLGRPLFWGGAYLVDGLLVDCGPPVTAREMLRFLEGRPLEGLVLTHHHEDHTGAAPLIAARRGLEPKIHPLGASLLEHGFPQELYRALAWGRRGRLRPGLLGSEVSSRRLRFQVLPTPGHSVDHVCLWQPERGWLFTGDLFLAERLKYLRDDEELTTLIDSLEAMGRLPVREVFCAHRGPVPDGPAALRRKANHLRALRERVVDLLGQGLPEEEVARRAVGPEGPLTWLSAGRFSARNFVRSVARGGRA
jgi:glyoxylase-like metal-dependent hydrolase (beta-lactamase superfamily II)